MSGLERNFNSSFHDYGLTSKGLIRLRDHGGLIYPSESVVSILQITEKCISLNLGKHGDTNKNLILKIESLVRRCLENENLFPDLNEHMFDQELGWNHQINYLVSKVINFYTALRIRKIAKNLNESMFEGSC